MIKTRSKYYDRLNLESMRKCATSLHGFSLVEALIAMAILGIITLAMSSIFQAMQKQQTILTEKLQTLETKNLLQTIIVTKTNCNFHLLQGTPNPIDLSSAGTSTPATTHLNYTAIRAGASMAAPVIASVGQSLNGQPGRMVVSSITLENIYRTTNPNEFLGDWTITLANNTLTQVIRPIKIAQIFTVNPPVTSATLNACGGLPDKKTQQGSALIVGAASHTVCRTITFPTPFSSTNYRVMLSPYFQDYGLLSYDITSGHQNKTTTGFDACFDHIGKNLTNNFNLDWMAIED